MNRRQNDPISYCNSIREVVCTILHPIFEMKVVFFIEFRSVLMKRKEDAVGEHSITLPLLIPTINLSQLVPVWFRLGRIGRWQEGLVWGRK